VDGQRNDFLAPRRRNARYECNCHKKTCLRPRSLLSLNSGNSIVESVPENGFGIWDVGLRTFSEEIERKLKTAA